MEKYPRIKELREDHDITQKEIAEQLGLYQEQYRRYENGKTTVPLWFAIEIAKYYNVTLDYVAGLNQVKKTDRFKK